MIELLTDAFSVASLISVFVLAALGLHFTFGMLNLVNLVHGEFLLIGAYVAFAVQDATGSTVAGMALAPVGAAVVGWALERSLLRFLYHRPLDSLLATFGLGVIIRQLVQLAYEAIPRNLNDPLRGSFNLGGVNLPRWRLLVVVAVVVLLAAITLLLNRTLFGLRARATVRNPALAETMGINVGRVRTGLFVVGSAVTGLAGALLAPLYTVDPQYGFLFLANAFLVVILGGPGSLPGLLGAGVVLGGALAMLQFAIGTVAAQVVVLLVAVVGVRLRPLLVERRRELRGRKAVLAANA